MRCACNACVLIMFHKKQLRLSSVKYLYLRVAIICYSHFFHVSLSEERNKLKINVCLKYIVLESTQQKNK